MALNLVDLDGTNGFRLDGVSAYGYSGRSVSIAGDVNGDGFDDLIVGAPSAVVDGIYSGGSYVVFGAGADFAASLDLATLDGTNGFGLGGSTASTPSATRSPAPGISTGTGSTT